MEKVDVAERSLSDDKDRMGMRIEGKTSAKILAARPSRQNSDTLHDHTSGVYDDDNYNGGSGASYDDTAKIGHETGAGAGAGAEVGTEVGTGTDSFVTGWRLSLLTLALALGLCVSSIESSIVSTSLVSITNELGEFSRSSWIVSAYLLTFTSFLVPLAKLSDVYGRRPVITVAVILFAAFSAAAGWSKSMVQLCVFRGLQGIGGGGLSAFPFVLIPDMLPVGKWGLHSAIYSSVFAISALLGPLAGGAINTHTTWRWIFWLNIPASVVILILLWLAMPGGFPEHNLSPRERRQNRRLARLDFVGAFFILSASLLFVAALESGGTQFSWSDATPISLLCVGLVCWLIFLLWQRYLSGQSRPEPEPVLAWRILSRRFSLGVLMNCFFVGAALIPSIIGLPQRFQIVDGSSPLVAGYRLLALTLTTPFGSIIAATLAQKYRLPLLYIFAAASVVQLLGLALYTALDAGSASGPRREQYFFMVLMGIGFGMSLSIAALGTPLVFQKRDMAVGMGALSQFRFLGGSIGIAGCASILNRQLWGDLANDLSPQQLAALQESTANLAALPPTSAQAFRESYARGARSQMILITALSAASILATCLLIEGKPRRLEAK